MARTNKELQEAFIRWRKHCQTIEMATETIAQETEPQKQARISRLRREYNLFCEYYFPHYLQRTDQHGTVKTTHNAKFHSDAAKTVLKHPTLKAAFVWPRGHAKSTHFNVFIPLWLLFQHTPMIKVMVVVGKSEESADILLGDLQAELEHNQRLIADFGPQKSTGTWLSGEFVTQSGAAFFARGRGQSPRGLRYREFRPDYIVIDDLDDDELCENQTRVDKLYQWVKEALFGALDTGRGRFIMVGNLISKNSVLQRIINTPTVQLSRIQALDTAGNPVWADKWTKEEALTAAEFMGYRAWQKEFMNNPITEGAVFRNEWIQWKKIPPLAKYDQLVAYCDPSFKSSRKSDYKAIKLWGKIGTELHHIRAFVRQCSVAEMVRWFYDLHEEIQAASAVCSYYIEANFMQDIILDEFEREGNLRAYQLPIAPDKRKKPDKFQRIEGISPLWERRFVYYNAATQDDKDTIAAIDQLLAFEKGSSAHDDAPDADEGAIYILQRRTRTDKFEIRLGKRPPPSSAW